MKKSEVVYASASPTLIRVTEFGSESPEIVVCECGSTQLNAEMYGTLVELNCAACGKYIPLDMHLDE